MAGEDTSTRGEVVTPDNPQSKLSMVREQLTGNSEVHFAGEIHKPNSSGWTETVDMFIAPVSPTVNVDQLNAFMRGLVTEIPPTEVTLALLGNRGQLNIGSLTFDESIGRIRKVIDQTVESGEPETLRRAGITTGLSTREEIKDLRRRSWVRVYPTAELAAELHTYEQGVQDGTVEPNDDYRFQRFTLSPEIIAKIKEAGSGLQLPNHRTARFTLNKLLRG